MASEEPFMQRMVGKFTNNEISFCLLELMAFIDVFVQDRTITNAGSKQQLE